MRMKGFKREDRLFYELSPGECFYQDDRPFMKVFAATSTTYNAVGLIEGELFNIPLESKVWPFDGEFADVS